MSLLHDQQLPVMSASSDTHRSDDLEAVEASTIDKRSSKNVERVAEADSKAESSDVADDSRWNVERNKKRYPDTLDCRYFKAIAISGSNLLIHNRFQMKYDTWFGAWRRRRGVMERGRSVLIFSATRADIPDFLLW